MQTKNKQSRKIILEAKNISKKFRKDSLVRTVFEKVSFSVSNGEIVGIIGKSGSGKTLIIQTLLNLESLDSGEILFHDQKISEMNKNELNALRKEKIALILRGENLFDFLSVNENLNLLFDRNASKEKYNEIVTLFDLDNILDQRLETLTWLDYQRVSLALAILKNPELVILDEPTGNLSKSESDEFMKILKDINQKTNIAFLIFSHDSSVAVSLNKIVRI